VMFGVENTPDGAHVRYALAAIKGAGEGAMTNLVAARTAGGPFTDVWDMLARTDSSVANKRQLEALIKAGALDALSKNPDAARPWLLHNLEQLLAYAAACASQKTSGQTDLFGGGGSAAVSPEPFKQGLKNPGPWTPLDKLAAEAEALGFYISAHPLESFAPELAGVVGLKPIAELEALAASGGGNCKIAAMPHSVREIKTKSGGRMGVVNVSDPSGQTEVALFTDAYAALGATLATAITHKQPLLITLRVQTDGDRVRIVADTLKTLDDALGHRRELTIKLANPAQAPQVQQLVGAVAGGPTALKLVVPTAHGTTVVRLPRAIACTPALLANLRGLPGVECV
jgi:DNA polymerase III subunit alpha